MLWMISEVFILHTLEWMQLSSSCTQLLNQNTETGCWTIGCEKQLSATGSCGSAVVIVRCSFSACIISNHTSDAGYPLKSAIPTHVSLLPVIYNHRPHVLRNDFSSQACLLLDHSQRCSVCDPAKIFLTSNLVIDLFLNPIHKTKTRTGNMWEGVLIAPHLDQ
jgi:hypothetical protein